MVVQHPYEAIFRSGETTMDEVPAAHKPVLQLVYVNKYHQISIFLAEINIQMMSTWLQLSPEKIELITSKNFMSI